MKPMIFIGYETGSKAYRLWDPAKRSVVISAKVRFDETVFPNHPVPIQPIASSSKTKHPPPPHVNEDFVEIPLSILFDDEPPYVSNQRTTESSTTSTSSSSPSQTPEQSPQSSPHPKSPTPPIIPSSTTVEPLSTPPNVQFEPPQPSAPTHPHRKVKPVERYGAALMNLASAKPEGDNVPDFDLIYLSQVRLFANTAANGEPITYTEATESDHADEWVQVMNEELASLDKMGTYEVVPRPNDHKVVGSKWVYRIKTDGAGKITRYKARLVAKGYSQQPGLDFTDTFAPVTRLESVRLLLGIAVQNDWEIRQVDVKTAYLYGDLEEEIYMEPPKGMDVPEGSVLLLKKALYGLKQAGRQWYAKLKEVLAKFDLKQVVSDPNTYVAHKVVNGKPCILVSLGARGHLSGRYIEVSL